MNGAKDGFEAGEAADGGVAEELAVATDDTRVPTEETAVSRGRRRGRRRGQCRMKWEVAVDLSFTRTNRRASSPERLLVVGRPLDKSLPGQTGGVWPRVSMK